MLLFGLINDNSILTDTVAHELVPVFLSAMDESHFFADGLTHAVSSFQAHAMRNRDTVKMYTANLVSPFPLVTLGSKAVTSLPLQIATCNDFDECARSEDHGGTGGEEVQG